MSELENISSDMNYLNISEIKSICEDLSIPYRILYQKEGRVRKTSTYDRKDVLLERIRGFLFAGMFSEPTILSSQVVNFTPLTFPQKEADLIYFGQYKNGNTDIDGLMKKLTGGLFKNGAIAYDVLREYWTKGKAPSYKEFAQAWMKAVEKHLQPKPEWAYLTDLASGHDMRSWKRFREEKAQVVLTYIKSHMQNRVKK